MQLALSNLDSNSNVDDGLVFADCRRNITSGLTQVASFMLIALNTVLFVIVQYMPSPAQTGLVFQNETHARDLNVFSFIHR